MESEKIANNKILLFVIGLVILISAIIVLSPKEKAEHIPHDVKMYLTDSFEITLEVADTEYSRSRGLMFREELEEDRGMLFVFEEDSKHGFWMKNTLIPLDMIFVDKNGLIVDIIKDIPPCEKKECESYTPSEYYRYVIETNSGLTDALGIKVGDQLDIPDLTPHQ